MSNEKEFVRFSVRVSKDINDWLDAKSASSGVPKSTLIYLALDQYIKQDTVTNELPKFMKQLEELQRVAEMQQIPEGSKRSGDSLKD